VGEVPFRISRSSPMETSSVVGSGVVGATATGNVGAVSEPPEPQAVRKIDDDNNSTEFFII